MNIQEIKKNNFFTSNKLKIKQIHFIGIGGSGMSGIALILLKLGYRVSGSDLLKNVITDSLINIGATVYFQHSSKNIEKSDLVIISSAIPLNNKEIIAAKKKNIPILLRAEMIQVLMQFKFGIAISGTHGKTTTTSMIIEMYIKSGLNPTFINGGIIKSIKTSAQLGSSHHFIVEADESDASFLYLNPTIAIVTNIESDHIDYYDGSFNKLKKTFSNFLKSIPFYGVVIACIDNKSIQELLFTIKCKIITYGFSQNSDVRIISYKQNYFFGYFTLIIKNKFNLNIKLNIPGKHNALNAAAAIALAINQGIKKDDIIISLKNFQGTDRRFDFLGNYLIQNKKFKNKTTMLIDDYGHHPTALSETIKTIRISWPNKKLLMIFQPHRYTRTHNLYYDFIKVLSTVDTLFILNVYSANELFIPGSDSYSLYNDIKKLVKINVFLISNNDLIADILLPKLNGNDIVLIQGAGNIKTIVHNIFINKTKKVIK